jgi:hypothetical protein
VLRSAAILVTALAIVGCGNRPEASGEQQREPILASPFNEVATCMRSRGAHVVTDSAEIGQLLRDLAVGDRNEPWAAGDKSLVAREFVPVPGTENEGSYRVLLVQPPAEPYTAGFVAEARPQDAFLVSLPAIPDETVSAAKHCVTSRL